MPAKSPKISESTSKSIAMLGEQIRAQRKALGLAATVAAESAGMSRITWYRIEKGEPSVTMGAWAEAARVLGLKPGLAENSPQVRGRGSETVPVRILLSDYPTLRKLAWHVRNGAVELSAREALQIFERNQRHLEPGELTPAESRLIENLRRLFG